LNARKIPHTFHKRNNPYLILPQSWHDFIAQRSKNFRRTINKKQKKLDNDGYFTKDRFKNPCPTHLFDTVFQLSTKSWQGQERLSVASSVQGRNFYRFLCTSKNEFHIDLIVLSFNNQCVAYLLGLLQNSSYHAFDTAFDSTYSQYSPGFLVHIYALMNLIEEEVTEFNFGYEHSYKERFQPQISESFDILVFKNTAIAGYKKIRDNLMRLQNLWKPRPLVEIVQNKGYQFGSRKC
jgi:CelD/BcsL family acetyltransferase involved in cellulose biosynthesis